MQEDQRCYARIVSEEVCTSHTCTPVTFNAIAAQPFLYRKDEPRRKRQGLTR